jgi:hypothetical protein
MTAPETSAAFARARELASRAEDASERFSAYFGLWMGHLNRCEPAPMREIDNEKAHEPNFADSSTFEDLSI